MDTRLSQLAEEWWIRHQRSPIRVLRWLLLWVFMWGIIFIVTPVALIGRLIGIRFLSINYKRIGHLAVEPDCFVKEKILGLHQKIIPCVCAPENLICNHAFLECWSQHIHWITNPMLCVLLKAFEWHPLLAFDVSSYVMVSKNGCRYVEIAGLWKDREPVIALPEQILKAGKDALLKMGVPSGAWFVCVHNREGGYSPEDEDWHSYRNCMIDDYIPAMEEIVHAGGWCIRVGDSTMSKLPPVSNSIDYAHHPLRADWLDIYLLAQCRFFLGNTSGPFLVASIFNRPVALANMTPIGATLPYGYTDLGIPKLLQRKGQPGFMSFPDMLRDPSGDYHFSAQFEKNGLVVVNNSADEIRALTLEMLRRMSGEMVYTKDDADLQEKFKQLLCPHHISYGSESRIGQDFIKKYCGLLS